MRAKAISAWDSEDRRPPDCDLGELRPEVRGALLTATLAYPGVDEFEKRDRETKRVFHRFIQPKALESLSGVERQFLAAGFRRLWNRLTERLNAGWVALHFLLADEQELPEQFKHGGKPSRRAIIRAHLQNMGHDTLDDLRNFERRDWDRSLPVIHLAAAWVELLFKDPRSKDDQAILHDLWVNPDYQIALIQRAQEFEGRIAQTGLGATTHNLIKLRI